MVTKAQISKLLYEPTSKGHTRTLLSFCMVNNSIVEKERMI